MTPTTIIDISRVPQLEGRQEAARLSALARTARSRFQEIRAATLRPVSRKMKAAEAALTAAERELADAKAAVVLAEFRLASRSDDVARLIGPDFFAAYQAAADADAAYHDRKGPFLRHREDGSVLCCDLAGLPLIEDDDVLISNSTGTAVLSCLVLPGDLASAARTEIGANGASDLRGATLNERVRSGNARRFGKGG